MPYYSVNIVGFANRVEADSPTEAIRQVRDIAECFCTFNVTKVEHPTCIKCMDDGFTWSGPPSSTAMSTAKACTCSAGIDWTNRQGGVK